MSETTFNSTKEDVRDAESEVSKKNQGNVPAESEPSLLKVSRSSDDRADDGLTVSSRLSTRTQRTRKT